MEIKRTYDHKTFGRIGEVTLVAPDGLKMTLDGTELPESSVTYLLTFALQSLQDAYAGAKNADEATGNFAKRLDRVKNGEMGVRSAREANGLTPELNRFLTQYRSNVKANAKVDATAYKDATPAERDAMLIKWIMAQPESARTKWEEVGADLLRQDEEARKAAADLF